VKERGEEGWLASSHWSHAGYAPVRRLSCSATRTFPVCDASLVCRHVYTMFPCSFVIPPRMTRTSYAFFHIRGNCQRRSNLRCTFCRFPPNKNSSRKWHPSCGNATVFKLVTYCSNCDFEYTYGQRGELCVILLSLAQNGPEARITCAPYWSKSKVKLDCIFFLVETRYE